MKNYSNLSAAGMQFRAMFPGVVPENGTTEQWLRLMRLAFETQNDLVDLSKRHTPASRRWERIGDEAQARAAAAKRLIAA